ncbi:MAG: hypothetical protein J6Y48_05565, partial [Clostridia bacterium]|nr:hypothetical protein [Clostridia bacterium]
MKKLAIILLAVIMMAACISPAMAARYYTSRFAAGADGWYARDAQSVYRTTDGMSWRDGQYPLLFNDQLYPKPAFYG